MRANTIMIALGMAGLVTLTGCGDSGGGSSSSTATYSVKAVDGYLRNAKVWLDVTPNGSFDEGEPSSMTGVGGVAQLDVSSVPNYKDYAIYVQIIKGQTVDEETIDKDNPNGVPETGTQELKALPGDPIASPFSTMAAENVAAGMTKEQAIVHAAEEAGISPSSVTGDFVASGDTNAMKIASKLVELQIFSTNAHQHSEHTKEVLIAQVKKAVEEETPLDTIGAPNLEDENGDGYPDGWVDTDNDGVPDGIADSDGDGVPDDLDEFDSDENEWMDSDGDGTGDNTDLNDDSIADPNNEGAFIDDDFVDDVDSFPTNPLKAGDHDNDGVDSIDDPMPYDHDNDGHNDDVDAFDDDPNEWLDSDGDGIGNNADINDDSIPDPDNQGEFIDDEFVDVVDLFPIDPDKAGDHDGDGQDSLIDSDDDNDGIDDGDDLYPFDASQAGDPDNDGVDTLVDAYPNDGTKSVADQITTNSAYLATLNINHRQVMMLNADVNQRIETFHDGSTQTTLTTTYTTDDNHLYGQRESVDVALSDGNFTRIEEFSFDFNLDGDAQFIGRIFDVGSRTAGGETFWRYVDESNAGLEGGVNGNGRVYDNVDFSARVTPSNLSTIDTIQHHNVNLSHNGEPLTTTTQMKQFVVEGFVVDDAQTHIKDYASVNTTISENLLPVYIKDEQDWEADASINTILEMSVGLDNETYTLNFGHPVWADPTDSNHQEYADFNFTPDNWDNLTNHWLESAFVKLNDTTFKTTGQRFVLDDLTKTKRADTSNPDGLLFNEWSTTKIQVSDSEYTEHTTWNHYALADYDFTIALDDLGQSYRITTRQTNGLWITTSFDEWGSQGVTELAEKVDTLRFGGTALKDIVVDGLSRTAAVLPNISFQYDEQGNPVQWYAVTQDPRLTDGTPTVVDLTLVPSGVLPNSYVMNSGTDMILVAPRVENPSTSFTDYYRQNLTTYAMNLDPLEFSWVMDLGQMFLDDALAQERLGEVLNPQYRVCSSQNTGEISGDVDAYSDFIAAANNCGYIGIDASYVLGSTLYYQESIHNYLSYQFNTSGNGVYYESGDDSTGSFTWQITPEGIVEVNNDGDMEYFAFIANQDDRYSMLGFFTWDKNATSYSEIASMEFTTDVPSSGDYRICSDHNTGELSGVGNVDDYMSYMQDANSCGYQPLAMQMIEGQTLYYVENANNYLSYQFNDNGLGVYSESEDGSSGPFNWQLTDEGIIEVNNDGDMEYFAYIANRDNKYSMLGLFTWNEASGNSSVPYSEILGMEFVTTTPQPYQECTTGDTEWVNDQPTSAPTLSDYSQAVADCGGVVTSAANILSGQTIYRQRGNGEIRAFEFNQDGTGHYYKNDYRHSDFTWVIEGDYIKIEYAVDDYEYFAYLNGDGQQLGLKVLSVWPENGGSISEIWFGRYSLTKPDIYTLRSCPVEDALSDRDDISFDEFKEVVASCGGHTDLSTANYDGDLSGYTYVRINSQGETRGFEFLADSADARSGSYNRLKNGDYRGTEGRSWEFTNDYLILTDGTGSTYDRLTLANISYVDGVDGDTPQSSFVAYEEVIEDGQVAESFVWSFVFREYESNQPITACNFADSPWDNDKDQPSDFATYSEFMQAVQACRVLTDDRDLKFTDSMLAPNGVIPEGNLSTVWSLGEGETLTFNPDRTGVWSEPNETPYTFTWSIDDQGYLVMSFENDDVETFVLTESDSKGYSIKGYWQPNDYGNAGWTNPTPAEAGLGEVWSGVITLESMNHWGLDVCTAGDQDDGSASLSELSAAISACGGHTPITENMVIGASFVLTYPAPHEENMQLTFNVGGTVSGLDLSQPNGAEPPETWTDNWLIEGDYLKVYWEETNYFQYWALLESSDAQWSIKILEQYDEDKENDTGTNPQQFILGLVANAQLP